MEISDLGNISSYQLRRFYVLLHKALLEKTDLQDSIEKHPEKITPFFGHLTTWADFYEMPFSHFIVFFIDCLGMSNQLNKALKGKEPIESVLKWMESDPDVDSDIDSISIEDQGVIISMQIALSKNIDAILRYSVSMHDLIRQFRENSSDEALFEAISIDRMVLTCPSATNRIAKAEFCSDRKFFHELAKAATSKKPRRPKTELDDLRYLLAVLDEVKSLMSVPLEKLHDVLVNDLQVYPEEGKDSFEGLKKLIQRRKKRLGT